MSKFTNLESLTDEISLWVESQISGMELHFDKVIKSENTVDQKILELRILSATGLVLINFLTNVRPAVHEVRSRWSNCLGALLDKTRWKISEYENLPEETGEEDNVPTPRKATELELAFKEAVEQLASETVILAKYHAGSAAIQTAYDRTKMLFDLLPADTSELPEELKNVPVNLNAIDDLLCREISRRSPRVRGIK